MTSFYSAKSTVRDFLQTNKRLVCYLILLLAGTFLGVIIYLNTKSYLQPELADSFAVQAVGSGFSQILLSVVRSCLLIWSLVLVLFVFGLTVYAAPVTLLAPLFYGLGLGLTEAFYYGNGTVGILQTLILLIPRHVIAAVALIMACSESLRFSLLLCRQLLPKQMGKELWNDFRLYCLRFLIFLCIGFLSGGVDVLLRLLFKNLI